MKISRKRELRKACLFGVELTKLLLANNVTQRHLAKEIGKCDQWLCDMVLGGRSAPPHAIDAICDALRAKEQDRYRLHIAAARDCGYKIPVFM